MKTLIFIVISTALLGCGADKKPEKVMASSNELYPVALLFTLNGCKVYKFVDADQYVYLTSCPGTRVQSKFCRSKGKARQCRNKSNEVIND